MFLCKYEHIFLKIHPHLLTGLAGLLRDSKDSSADSWGIAKRGVDSGFFGDLNDFGDWSNFNFPKETNLDSSE